MNVYRQFLSAALASVVVLSSVTATSAQEATSQDSSSQAEVAPATDPQAEQFQNRLYLPAVFAAKEGGVEQVAEESPDHSEVPQESSNQFLDSSSTTDQLIVHYRGETADNTVQASAADRVAQVEALSALAGVDLSYLRDMADASLVLKLPTSLPLEEMQAIAQRLTQDPAIEYAEPDTVMQPFLQPNDTLFAQQWHYSAPVANSFGINLPAAWDLTTGSASVVVAVVDTGSLNHPDLAGRFLPGYDFISNVSVANDGNGRDNNASDPGDWITAAESAGPIFTGCQVHNSSWHGTHVAGTIAANSNNGSGVAGVNWQARIVPVRVLGKCGGSLSDIADGIRWAAGLTVSGVPANANPARVINMSLGGPGSCSLTYQNAINAATTAGASVVVAAGNSNLNAANFQPASCNNVITVAATNRVGNRAGYSNFGATVEISAPGGETNVAGNGVLSTLNAGTTSPTTFNYVFYQGTSMATPHVVGVVSLMVSVNPLLTPAQILTILQSTVTPFPAGSTCNTSNCGSGIVNAFNAVRSARNITNDGSWTQIAGALKHVSVGCDGTVWGVNAADQIYRRDGNSWTQIAGGLKQISVGNANNVWGVNAADQIFRRDGTVWTQIAGGLKHVSVGCDGTVWGVNAADQIYRRDGNSWTQIPGALKQISVGNANNVWGVNASDQIYRRDGNAWTQIGGALKFVSVGNDGTVWGVNASDQIYRRDGNVWTQIAGALKQISVGNINQVWGVNAADQIFRRDIAFWTQVGGALKHVSVGCDGTVWGVNAADQIYRRDGNSWTQIAGGLKQISVGNANNVWGVNSADQIYRRDGNAWTQIGGALKHVSVGCDGTVWGVNASDQIYRRDGNSWTQIPGALKQISVGNANNVWGVNAADQIFRRDGNAWTQIGGALKFVSVGNDGTVWGVNASNQIFRRDGNVWTQIAGALKQISVGNANNIWGVNVSDQIFNLW